MKRLACLALLLIAACTPPPGRVATGYDVSTRAEAAADHERLRGLAEAGEWTAAQAAAADFLERYPGIEREDQVLLLGARVAVRNRDDRTALAWLQRLVDEHPQSPRLGQAWLELADLHARRLRWRDAAAAYLAALEAGIPEDREEASRVELRRILEEELPLTDLETLAKAHPADGLGATTLRFLVAQRRFDQGTLPDEELGATLEDFLRRYPDSRFAPDVQRMLAEVQRRSPYVASEDLPVLVTDRIGILCPLTGENSALGHAMYDGALLALEEHNRRTGANVVLVSQDTRGDGVRAVQAARHLIEREGVVAVVGALLSATTVPVATLCQERGVPLVSPTATQETIGELGPFVFQTNLTKAVETRLVATAAVDYLRKRRFAIVHPKSDEGVGAAELFAGQVRAAGAEVVAVEALERGTTAFGAVLRRLRAAGPEAIFAPLSASEMRLLAPQFTFYEVETQLLGPSGWNNSLLSREVGDYLDRAIFPSDIALIPNAERDRFDALWRRRFPGSPSSPFALKTYFAVQQILLALEEGVEGRDAMRVHLDRRLGFGGESARLGLEKLRMLVDGEVQPFPLDIFPGAAPIVPGLQGRR